jgi:hypothetical protein
VKRIEAAAPAGGRCSGGGAVAVREERKGGARDEEGVALPFYSPEREGRKARRRWSGSSPAGH